MTNITHIIFAGNAMRSICLLGVIRYLYCYNLQNNIKCIIGSSMGSFFGFALCLKIPYEDLEDYVKNIITDDTVTVIQKKDFANLFINNGMDKTINYLLYFRKYIKKKYDVEDITFLELAKKTGIDFNVSVTNINNYKNVILNLTNSPNVSVFDAIAASMTIPFMSEPVLIDGYYYIDGCLTNNFPIELFENVPRENILGVIVSVDDYTNFIPKDTEINFYTYATRIFEIIVKNTTLILPIIKIKNTDNLLIIKESHIASVNLDINKDYIRKDITIEDIDKLILQGYTQMFNNYSKSITTSFY
jgi:predicted acylesterase/phospholipase RssA